jgi:hypothetical protein
MDFRNRTIKEIADMICGNFKGDESFFRYPSRSYLTEFFQDCGTNYCHDGSTGNHWVAETLRQILAEPRPATNAPPETFARVIRTLMDPGDAVNEGAERGDAFVAPEHIARSRWIRSVLCPDKQCYLRDLGTGPVAVASPSPHRAFTASERERRELLTLFLDHASGDVLIEEILMPLFRQIGFHRVTAAGHKDKALEYGKDLWMKFTLPTQRVLYFGIQAKKGKLDASGVSHTANANVAEIHNQVTMMLGHEIFDPEIGRRVLVDHAFIVGGGEITKAARNWLGGKLDASKRSQIMFMDREDLLNLFVVTKSTQPQSRRLKFVSWWNHKRRSGKLPGWQSLTERYCVEPFRRFSPPAQRLQFRSLTIDTNPMIGEAQRRLRRNQRHVAVDAISRLPLPANRLR